MFIAAFEKNIECLENRFNQNGLEYYEALQQILILAASKKNYDTEHNGGNDSHKRQFLALGVRSQSWKLNNLSKKNSCQIDWCYKLLATI